MAERCIAVDIGGTKILVAEYDKEKGFGKILRGDTPKGGKEAVIRAAVKQVQEYERTVGFADGVRPDSIGMGVNGLIDPVRGYWLGYTPEEEDIDAAAIVYEAFPGIRLQIDNDVKCTVVAENEFGNGRHARDMVYINVGTGLAAGMIVCGKLVRGKDGFAGEVGFTQLTDPRTAALFDAESAIVQKASVTSGRGEAFSEEAFPLSGSEEAFSQGNFPVSGREIIRPGLDFPVTEDEEGRDSDMEMTASGMGLSYAAKKYARYFPDSVLCKITGRPVNGRDVTQGAAEGDAFAKFLLRALEYSVTRLIEDFVCILSPERVILGGGLVRTEEMLERIYNGMSLKTRQHLPGGLLQTGLDTDLAGLYGAAALGLGLRENYQ